MAPYTAGAAEVMWQLEPPWVRCLMAVFFLACLSAAGEESATIAERTAALRRWVAEGNEKRVRAYLQDESSWIRIEATKALLRIRPGDPEAMALLRAELRSADPEAADVAACALASAGEEGLRILVAEVQKDNARTAPMYGLLSLESIDPALLLSLKDLFVEVLSTSKVPREVARCLALAAMEPTVARACAPHAVTYLQDVDLAQYVLLLLDAAGPDDAFVGPLRRFIHNEKLKFPPTAYGMGEYELASSILCRTGPEGIRPVLERLATVRFEPHRLGLAQGLEKHLDVTFGYLLAAARSPEPLLRQRVLEPLTSTRVKDRKRGRKVMSLLRDLMLHDPDADVRAETADRLYLIVRRFGEIVGEAELRSAVLSHSDEKVRLGALDALLEVSRESVGFLRACLNDPSENVRLAAISGLGAHGPAAADALERIVTLIRSGDDPAICLDALVRIAPGDKRVLKAASERLDAKDERVARAAAWALATIGPPARKLEERLRALPPARSKTVRLWRLYALWRIAGRSADLHLLLKDLDASIRCYGTCLDEDMHALRILTLLGTDARCLAPVIDAALANEELIAPQREWLERVRQKLGK